MDAVSCWYFLNGAYPSKLKVRADVLGRLSYEAFIYRGSPTFGIETFMGLPVEVVYDWDAPEYMLQ